MRNLFFILKIKYMFSFRPSSITFSQDLKEVKKEECKECKMLETDNRVLRKQIQELVEKQLELEKLIESFRPRR